ncbi:MAG: 50S ribosomal protein L5 [bacterium]
MNTERVLEKLNKVYKELGYKNALAAPKLEKIVVNIGFGRLKDDKKFIESVTKDVSLITGQAPNCRSAKKSIAGFKLREGDVVGIAVTLRGKRMWDFYEKLTSIVFPRFRDFKGFSKKAMDKNGNYSLGITDHTVFSEIDANKVDKIKSLQIVLVTSTNNSDLSYKFLKILGFPFRD